MFGKHLNTEIVVNISTFDNILTFLTTKFEYL